MPVDLTPLLRRFSRRRIDQLRRQHAVDTQRRQLSRLIRHAADTAFGRDHRFDRIQTVDDYQTAVPLRTYEEFWRQYWKPSFPVLTDCTWPGRIPYFALTSGTTSGKTKHIPCSIEMIRSNSKAGMDLLVFHQVHRPQSRISGGKHFMLGGSTDLKRLAPGVLAGDLSGIAAKTLPWWIRPWCFPSLKMALMSNWEEKIGVLADLAPLHDLRMIGGVPSWLLLFFNRLFEGQRESASRLVDIFPNLELVVHGGVQFAPYLAQFQQLLSGARAELREVYPASEGFIGIADRHPEEGMRLITDHGIFYEFVPLEELDRASPSRHWVDTIATARPYAVVLTTCAGLWSYILGDTVEFVQTDPPRLRVTGRTDHMLSNFGEHLIVAEIECAVAAAAELFDLSVVDFAVGAVTPRQLGELGHHRFIIEFAQGGLSDPQRQQFARAVDRDLQSRNADYAAHRAEGYGLSAPEILVAGPGFFKAWMKQRGKLGGQHKVPRIITQADMLASLSSQLRQYNLSPADA